MKKMKILLRFTVFFIGFSITAQNFNVAGGIVTIEGNAFLTLEGDFNNEGTVALNSGSSIIVEGSSTGDIIYNRSFPSTNWHLVSSPVQGQQYDNSYVATNELASNGSNKAIASYVSSDNSWDYLQENETKTFDLGTGLSMKKASDAGDISFTGTINVSDAGVAVTLSDGNNLIGNPYPSYIPANMSSDDFNNILVVNEDSLLEKTLYFWDQSVNAGAGEYIEINQTSNAMFISPAQGFFVKHDNTKSSNTFTFNEAMQSHSNSGDTFLKGATRTEVNLTITDGASTNSTDIYYIEQTTPGFDNGYDSTLFYNGGTDFGIYTHLVADSVGDDYGIQSLPKNNYENMIVPVGVNALSSSEIVISATAINLPSEINIYLEDKNNNSFTLLDDASTYTTTLSKDLNGIGRFYMHTTSGVLSTDDLISNNNFSIYTSSIDNLRILGVHTGVANVCMYDILGKEVLRNSFEGNSVNDIALPNLKKGVYIVQLSTETGIINKKISLQKQ
jgi:hypothetical protein